jgi:hypothetical protein
LVVALAAACSDGPTAIAVLDVKSDAGVVERNTRGITTWAIANPGTEYFSGDAARTAPDTSAQLRVRDYARLEMQGNTVLRFSGNDTEIQVSVESGAIDLSSVGTYSLDVGDIKRSPDGKVRITAATGHRSVVELSTKSRAVRNSQEVDLVIVKAAAVEFDLPIAPPIDAGVRDARVIPPDQAIDAPPDAAAASTATIEVTGKRAELLAPGATRWTPLPAGAGQLAGGSGLRLGPGTTAKLIANATSLELAGGSRVKLDDDLALTIESGATSAAATAPAKLAVPGGGLALGGSQAAPAAARIEANGRATRITVLRGAATLTGAGGADLAMRRGESAQLTQAGAIRIIDAIPSYFDIRIKAGETLTIHDPRPPTAVQFQFGDQCADGIIEVDRDRGFRTPRVSSGHDVANVMLSAGTVWYHLRCTVGGVDGPVVVSGRVTTVQDDGRRPLPKIQSINDIDADGRNYGISYQSTIPNLAVHVRNPGAVHKLHLALGGKEQTYESSTPRIVVPGKELREGKYIFWIDRDGVRQDKSSNLTIAFEQTAPQVYLESPINGQPWSGGIDVRGAVLPDWKAEVDGIAIPIDSQRRFAAKVDTPRGNALAIKLSHPQRGVHYYLRREK